MRTFVSSKVSGCSGPDGALACIFQGLIQQFAALSLAVVLRTHYSLSRLYPTGRALFLNFLAEDPLVRCINERKIGQNPENMFRRLDNHFDSAGTCSRVPVASVQRRLWNLRRGKAQGKCEGGGRDMRDMRCGHPPLASNHHFHHLNSILVQDESRCILSRVDGLSRSITVCDIALDTRNRELGRFVAISRGEKIGLAVESGDGIWRARGSPGEGARMRFGRGKGM